MDESWENETDLDKEEEEEAAAIEDEDEELSRRKKTQVIHDLVAEDYRKIRRDKVLAPDRAINTECVQFFQECLRCYKQSEAILRKLQCVLQDLSGSQLESVLVECKYFLVSSSEMDHRFSVLSAFKKDFKIVLYFKAQHVKNKMDQNSVSILYLVQRIAQGELGRLARHEVVSEMALKLLDLHKKALEERSLFPTNTAYWIMTRAAHPRPVQRLSLLKNNTSPTLGFVLKQTSATKLLQTLAKERSRKAAIQLLEVVTNAVDTSSFTENGRKKPALTAIEVVDPLRSSEIKVDLTRGDHVLTAENRFLDNLLASLSQVPTLLGKGAVKRLKTGELKVTKNASAKIAGYYHEALGQEVGDIVDDAILWDRHILPSGFPLSLVPPSACLSFRNGLRKVLEVKEAIPPMMMPPLHSLLSGLVNHVIVTSWDVRFIRILMFTSNPNPRGHTRECFVDTLEELVVLLNDLCGVGARELGEGVQSEEMQLLGRLDATLTLLTRWTRQHSQQCLNRWQVQPFFTLSQKDTSRAIELMNRLQLNRKEDLMESEDVGVRLCAKLHESLIQRVQKDVEDLKMLPETCLKEVPIVCRTISLATLQTHMPGPKYWRRIQGSALKPSRYVGIYLEEVLAPVADAISQLEPKVQTAAGKAVVTTVSEAWLHHIYSQKLKFSDLGSQQLLRDFLALRDWLRNCEILDPESRSKILDLDILRQCEGVARLLLRRPGDMIGVVSRNQVAPEGPGSDETRPAQQAFGGDSIPVEMYVPNQEQWLALRAEKAVVVWPCFMCCK